MHFVNSSRLLHSKDSFRVGRRILCYRCDLTCALSQTIVIRFVITMLQVYKKREHCANCACTRTGSSASSCNGAVSTPGATISKSFSHNFKARTIVTFISKCLPGLGEAVGYICNYRYKFMWKHKLSMFILTFVCSSGSEGSRGTSTESSRTSRLPPCPIHYIIMTIL